MEWSGAVSRRPPLERATTPHVMTVTGDGLASSTPVRPTHRVASASASAQVRGPGTTGCQESPNLRHCERDGPGCLTGSAPLFPGLVCRGSQEGVGEHGQAPDNAPDAYSTHRRRPWTIRTPHRSVKAGICTTPPTGTTRSAAARRAQCRRPDTPQPQGAGSKVSNRPRVGTSSTPVWRARWPTQRLSHHCQRLVRTPAVGCTARRGAFHQAVPACRGDGVHRSGPDHGDRLRPCAGADSEEPGSD